MRSPEETIIKLNLTIDNLLARPKMFGTNQEALWVQVNQILEIISFISDKKLNWFRVHIDTDATLDLPESSIALPGRNLSDEKFMEGLRIMRMIANKQMEEHDGKTTNTK